MRKQVSKSIEDLKNNGYFDNGELTWYDFKEMNLLDYHSNLKKKYTNDMNLSETANKKLYECSHKFTKLLIRPPETGRKYIEYTSELFEDPFKFATDNLFSLQEGFKISRNLYFYGAIRDVLQRLFESGIMQHFSSALSSEQLQSEKLQIHRKQEQYSTLTWNQLYPGFYIWLLALLICSIVFIGEILSFEIEFYLSRK